MSWTDIRILYLRELRDALRERQIVINSVLIPLLLYPLLLWLMFSAIVFVRGQEERFVSRLALVGLPEAHADLRDELTEDGQVELLDPSEDDGARITAGELDARVEFQLAEDAGGLAGNFRVRLTYDGSKDRSAKARERVETALDAYRGAWIRREAEARGIDDAAWEQFYVERRNVASSKEVGAFVLGLLAPMLMIIMIAVGTFYPAVDATAGERERSTWETLMTVSASRTSVLVAKYLYVATLGCVAGLLNLTAMTVSMRAVLGPILGDEDLKFSIPLAALPLMVLVAMLLALFIAAGMMIFASFARTFKEGQSMVTPFYLLIIMPPLLVQSPDLELDLQHALIPIVNVALLFREAITGTFHWPMIGLTFVVEAATVAVLLWVARRMLDFEDVLIGSYGGSAVKFVKERLLRRDNRSGEKR